MTHRSEAERSDRGIGTILLRGALVASLVGFAAPVVAVATAPPAAAATTFVVNRFDDVASASCASGSSTCTLRAAVAAANAIAAGGVTIQVPAGTHLTSGGKSGDTGDLDITRSMTIVGPARQPGAAAATIRGTSSDRVLDIAAAGVVVSGVVITGGNARTGAGINIASGAGLTLRQSTVIANNASDDGAAIANAGTLTLETSTLSGNVAVKKGGALFNTGTATVVNTTMFGNTANAGGGVISTGTAALLHVTITANTSTNRLGGGLQRQGGVVNVRGSIIARNNANGGDAKDCSGSPNFEGLNLIGNVQGCNPTGVVPLTGEAGLATGLADNGGPTQTQALLGTSAALDRITPPCGATTDQRGITRPGGAKCDLGAYELEMFDLDLTLAADVTDAGVGASTVPLDALHDATTGPAPGGGTTGTAMRSIAMRSIAMRSITVDSVAMRSIAMRSIAMRSIAMRSIAMRSIDEASSALGSSAMRSILLSELQLSATYEAAGGWEALLAGTEFANTPLQNLTLADVIGLARVADLTLFDVDITSTRIGSLSLASLLLGTTAMRSIPLAPDVLAAAGGDNLLAWCQMLGDAACDELGLDPAHPETFGGVSLLSVDLTGTAMRSILLSSILLAGLDLAGTAMRSIPINLLEPGSIPDVVDCGLVNCASATLGDADLANALHGTMADLLLAILGAQDVPWERFNLEDGGVQPIASPLEPTFGYTLGIDLKGGTPADVDVVVTMPRGFAHKAGTAQLDGATTADPAIALGPGGETLLTFRFNGLSAGHHGLTFQAWAGLRLGPTSTSAQATATAGTAVVQSDVVSDAVQVDEAFEDDTGYREINDDLLHIAHLSEPGDVDLYHFTVTAEDERRGAHASIRLGNLPADYDLALYGPPLAPLRGDPTEHRDLLPDHLLDTGDADDNLTAEPTADVPQVLPFATTEVIHRISARRSTAAEEIVTGSLRAGSYWVQVSGANGAFDDSPYALRVRLQAGVDRGPCAASSFTFATPAPAAATAPTGIDTIFLVNRQRLSAAYGPAAGPALTALDAFAARTDLGFRGAVVSVDSAGPVRDASAAWDADRCSPAAANGVVSAIGDVLDAVRTANPGLVNVVLVGDDLQLPFARVPDGTALSNEMSFADELPGNNELVAALARGYVLSDNPYGSTAGIAVNDHELFIPELAVGRLVETPGEIVGALSRFASTGGLLDVASTFVAGYDFLADGSDAVADALGSGTETLIDHPGVDEADDEWDRTDLATALAALDAPAVVAIDAHFDHHRALPALGDTTGDESDLFTTADISGGVAEGVENGVLFSMGCHGGLNVADLALGAPTSDWAQTFAGVAGAWVGETGYGYGDTELVALSEDLLARFAARLAGGESAGLALVGAKADYASHLGLVGPYDEKVLHETTTYGLPMLRVGGAGGQALRAGLLSAPADPTLVTDPHTGLPSTTRHAGFTIGTDPAAEGPGMLTPAETDDGDYFHVQGDTLNQAHRPVEPRASYDVTRADARQPSGVLVTSLTSIDIPGFDPLFFSPTVDLGAHEPRSVAADATFPARFVDVTSTPRPGTDEQRLVVVPGQFRASDTAGVGTQRLFTDLDTVLYYPIPAAQGAGRPVSVEQTIAAATGGTAHFEVDLDGSAVRVYVLYKHQGVDVGGATWTGIDLVREPGTDNWFAQGPGADPLEYIVQVVAADGSVYWATSKGADFGSVPGGTPSDLSVVVSGPPLVGGWYPGPVTVMATGVGVTYSLDGQGFVAYTGPVQISTDGLHTVLVRDANGNTETRILRVDATGPTSSATVTPSSGVSNGPVQVDIGATDGNGSGVASITYRFGSNAGTTVPGSSLAVQVSDEGPTTVSFYATDVAGNPGPERSTVVTVDTLAPAVICPAPSSAWLATNPSFTCTASDGGTGLATGTPSSFTLATNVAAGTENASAATDSRVVCDVVGNCATAGPISPVKVDRKAPTVAITSPVNGAFVPVGASLTASFSCTDGGSGMIGGAATCTAAVGSTPVVNGGALPTSTRGTFTLMVTSRDAAGNLTTPATAVSYTVGYGICLQYDPTKPANIGSGIAIRIQLCEGSRNVSSQSIVVEAVSIDGGPPPPPNFQGSSNLGNRFRLETASKTYNYNLDTTGLAAGSHLMYLRIGGVTSPTYVAPFVLR